MRRYNLKENYDDTFTTVLGLHFDVAKYHFLQGEMILKCTSSLLSVYWQSSEVSTKPPLLPCKVSNKTKLQNEQLRKAKARKNLAQSTFAKVTKDKFNSFKVKLFPSVPQVYCLFTVKVAQWSFNPH